MLLNVLLIVKQKKNWTVGRPGNKANIDHNKALMSCNESANTRSSHLEFAVAIISEENVQ